MHLRRSGRVPHECEGAVHCGTARSAELRARLHTRPRHLRAARVSCVARLGRVGAADRVAAEQAQPAVIQSAWRALTGCPLYLLPEFSASRRGPRASSWHPRGVTRKETPGASARIPARPRRGRRRHALLCGRDRDALRLARRRQIPPEDSEEGHHHGQRIPDRLDHGHGLGLSHAEFPSGNSRPNRR